MEQFSKNGCTSPQAYSGSLTSPPFDPNRDSSTQGAQIDFSGWFEIESVNPGTFDSILVQYQDPTTGGEWIPVTNANLESLFDQSEPNSGGAADVPYSNMGTGVRPDFQPYTFELPPSTNGQIGVQVRIHFNTTDETYQGFRGVGIDSFRVSDVFGGTNPNTNFTNGPPAGWTFDGPSGPGGPFWDVPVDPTAISIKSPEINPDLVTLSAGDNGALPVNGTRYAWFGNPNSGTFCGPDFALRMDLAAPDTTITSGPAVRTASNDATFEFTSNEPAAGFQCQVDSGFPESCGSPKTYTELSEGSHTFSVSAIDFAGNVDPTPATYSWTIRPATLADLDNPTLGVDVNVQEVRGTVLVGLRGSAARASGKAGASQKGITFVPLSEAEQIPVGSFIDTRRGTVRLESASNARGKRQRGTFLQGLFQVRQSKKRSARGLTDLVLKGSSFRRCRARGSGEASASGLSRRAIRRLRANARGRYRTSGRNSAATVRGTKWGVTDRCDGTLTKVQRGTVVVRDFRRKKNVIVRAGKSYLARARR